MKKYFSFQSIIKMMCMVMAVVFGGSAMAAEAGEYGGDADPNKGKPTEGGVNMENGGIVQHGSGMATGDKLQEVGLLDNKMFQKIIEHHALRFPFFTDMFTLATQYAFKGHKEAEYPEIGDIKLEAYTKAEYTGVNANSANIFSCLHSNDASIFRKNFTIIVIHDDCKGYDEGKGVSDGNNGEALMLYVTDNNDSTTLQVEAVNGPTVSGKTVVPTIPAGALFLLGAPALAEEEVEVDPINEVPTTKKAYLQKKAYSVAITDFFEEAVKEVDWEKSRVKRQALDAYKKIYTVTSLFGSKRKFYKRNKNGQRIVYTQAGLINTIRMAYQLQNGVWTKNDVIAITKMLFGAYTDATEMNVYMGDDAMESLLKIEWGDDAMKLIYQTDEKLKIKVAVIETSFGTLKFKRESALTQFHLEKAAIAMPMEECIRVYRDNGSTKSVDGNKGETGAVEELKKEFFIQDDCFICNALNSMLIGPAEAFQTAKAIDEVYNSVKTLPTASSANEGKLFYLTEASGNYAAGLYKCVDKGTSSSHDYQWESYKRDFSA